MRQAPARVRRLAGIGSKHLRVLRGGSFNNNAENVRCAYRNRNNPNNQNNNFGFRVVVSTFVREPELFGGVQRPFRAEANGGADSWPRPEDSGRANSNGPAAWV